MALRAISFLIFLFLAMPSWAVTLYVSPDGGTGTQCDGLTDHAYPPVSGTACRLNHPNWVFPPAGSALSTARAAGAGYTVVIEPGQYRIGCQNTTNCIDATLNMVRSQCNESASYDCYPTSIPNNVTVVGCTSSGCGCTYNLRGNTTCTTTRPELWGAGNVLEVINVTGSSGVTLKDFEITDHANCNLFNISWTCRHPTNGLSYPAQLAAQFGINATNATNLTITGVNNHGVGYEAMRTTNVNGLTITGSNFNYAMTGMNNDNSGSCTTCGMTGAIVIDKSSFNGNGCLEDWQNDGTKIAASCCSQSQGCSSADALGMGNTGGNWTITDTDFSYNTADGLDLLYHNRGIYSGGTLTIKKSRAEGNAGNSFKASNATTVEDSFALGNCAYFQNQPFTYSSSTFDHCRSNTGSPFAFEFHSGDVSIPSVTSSTVSSNGNIMFLTSGNCATGQNVISKNNILIGGRQWNDDSSNPLSPAGGNKNTTAYYDSGTDGNGANCNTTFVDSNNICVGNFNPWATETTACSGTNSTSVTNAGLLTTGTILQGPYSSPGYFGSTNYSSSLYLQSTSPAINRSNTTLGDSVDFNNFARGSQWDTGAVELNSISTGSTCGNGFRDAGESCEGADLNAETCVTQGYASGTLACSASCTFNYSGCVASTPGFCGDGTTQAGLGETCDDGNTTNSDCCSAICETEVSGYERLLTYTSTAPAGYLTTTTHKVVVAGLDRNINATLYKDGGASHFGDFTTTEQVNWTSCVAADGTCDAAVWALSSTLRSNIAAMETALDGVYLELYQTSAAEGSVYEWCLSDTTGTASSSPCFIDPDHTQPRYAKIVRSGSTIIVTIYSTSSYSGTPLGTVTLLGSPTTAYRYFYPIMSRNDGFTDAQINLNIQNINIGESILSCSTSGGGGSGSSNPNGNSNMTGRCGALGRFTVR